MLKLGTEKEHYCQVVSGNLKLFLLLVLSFIPAPLVNHNEAKAMALDAGSRQSSETA